MDMLIAMILIALISFFSAFVVAKIKNTSLHYLSALLIPFIISNIFYWIPCLLLYEGGGVYFTFSAFFLVPTFIIGIVAMFFGIYFFKWKNGLKK